MKKISQYILAFLFFALIFELIIMGPVELKESLSDQPVPVQAPVVVARPDMSQSMAAIHVIETRSENKEWELWADSAMGQIKKGDLDIKNVKVNFFSSNGTIFDVTGDTGSVVTETKNLTIDGSVLTKSSNGYIFKTTTVEYNSGLRTLKSATPVEFLGPKDEQGHALIISGDQLNADLNMGVVLIEKNVRARKSVSNDKNMSVYAERVELSGHDKALRFSGNVVIDLDGMRISGPDALFNYDKDAHQINSINLSGGVKVSDLSKWATSDTLKINLVKNEYIFDGQPRVVQDNDELRGDRIIFLDGGKKVRVQNAKIKVSKDSLEDTQPKKEL